MNIKKIIKENSFDDLEWISQSRPSLHNTIILFEPMISNEEYTDNVLPRLGGLNELGDNIRWWSNRYDSLDEYIPVNEYFHHLIISMDGKMVYGGLDDDITYDLRDEGYTEHQIRNSFDDMDQQLYEFVDSSPSDFNQPQTVDGRNFFNIPYIKSVNENVETDFDWVRDDIETPLIYFKELGYGISDIVGFKVRISENSEFYDERDEENPIEEIGFITDNSIDKYTLGLGIQVRWPGQRYGGNFTNNYDWDDLIFVNRGNRLNESQDDFDWVRDIQPPSPHIPQSGMKFKIKSDVGNVVYTITNMTDTHMVINWVDPNNEEYTENFKWPLKQYFNFVETGDVEVVYENLNESNDDFNWIEDIEPNIFNEYKLIILDRPITMFEFERILLDAEKYGSKNISAWTDDINESFTNLTNNSNDYYRYLRIDLDADLMMGVNRQIKKSYTKDQIINLSDLFGTKLLESDDFDWIRDTEYPIQIGDKYRTPNGNILTITHYWTEDNINFIGWDVWDVDERINSKAQDYEENFISRINDNIWVKVDNSLNESEDDFDWIRELEPVMSATDLQPNERYKIVRLEGPALEEYNDDYDLSTVDPYDHIFIVDGEHGFMDKNDEYLDYGEPKATSIWVQSDTDSDVRSWVSLEGLYVVRV